MSSRARHHPLRLSRLSHPKAPRLSGAQTYNQPPPPPITQPSNEVVNNVDLPSASSNRPTSTPIDTSDIDARFARRKARREV